MNTERLICRRHLTPLKEKRAPLQGQPYRVLIHSLKSFSGHLLLDVRYLLGAEDTMMANIDTVYVFMEFMV